ncbi:hypothetical protein [Dyadobacter sp. CY323]|uniref:hypothetical protein n=1 Tax=Dyadobacter sp. CY323 TaxID=2907302 RepID=UPI001F2FE8AB|nr:hypothetical protein [Dyadobacter sp. CY323]MCE6989541.1 hypothetical protein [Dyadobacter sp. CY323]
MIKSIQKKILPFQEANFFLAIRDKIDYAWVVVHSAQLLLLDMKLDFASNSSMKLVINDMSRLFFYKESKFYSISFPFKILFGEFEAEITTYFGTKVDNQSVSSAIAILRNEKFKLNPSPVNFWIDTSDEELPGLWLLEEIFLFEPGYIRYDIDPKNENGRLHPLHHLDINYSSYGTYKLGLNKEILDSHFEDILNIATECSFLAS